MKKKPIDISLVMISYNTKQITLNALRSIYKHSKNVNFEIIMVDHNSKDGSVLALEKFSKTKNNLTFLDTKKNPGFGAGNNLGAKKALGKYLLFINTDVLLRDNVLKKALTWIEAHPKIGAYSCKLLNKDLTVQATGGYFPTLSRVFAWQLFIDDLPIIRNIIRSVHPHQPHYNKSRSLDWVTGAFTIIPRKLFEDLGGFDENIWMYAEELELCYRIKKMGYSVTYQNSPSLIHLGGSSSGESRFGLAQETKNLIYFYKKHKPAWQLPIVKLLFITGSVLRFIIFGIIGNNETARKAYLQAIKLAI
ncbi:glycosyltransferase family 2 protein [Patescibacteria group bacterium]|nr:glycosyltransferase family 2 protein [Patescibacteria group bacterium]